MAVHSNLAALAGNWTGTNRLNLSWTPDPIKESPSTAKISPRINGQCLEIAYTWVYDGQPQEGVLLLCGGKDDDKMAAAWTDSWHSADVMMPCGGTVDAGGNVNIKGSYSVPDHPAWGWRTEIIPGSDGFKYLMFNVTPEGEEEWAVETEFTRS